MTRSLATRSTDLRLAGRAMRRLALAAGLLSLCATAMADSKAEHPGQKIYQDTCAVCHDRPEATRSPSLDTLKQMRFQILSFALTKGKMQAQASGLSDEERASLIDYLVGVAPTQDAWIADMMCPDNTRAVDTGAPVSVSTFGFDKHNHRHLSSAEAGLETGDFSKLELAWSMAFPGATTMRSQPAVVGNTLFLPVADAAKLFAIDVSGPEPCLQWVYDSDAPLRSSAAYGELADGRKVVAVSDLGASVHLVDAKTGEGIWKTHVGSSALSLVTGTPVVLKEQVIVPISQYEIMVAAADEHVCCTSHGAVSALDAKSGKVIWTTHTMEEAKPVRDRGDGQMIWGPSGAPIWNSPAIDEKRGLLYVGTGEATSEPAHPNTNAILAIALKDGAIKWSFQATADDIFISGCGPRSKSLNCPKPEDTVYRDVDFGASVILGTTGKGQDLLFAGQKSGSLWALNRDTGKVVWRRDFGEGSPLGGIHWGIAFDGERVYAPINRAYSWGVKPKDDQKPGIHAVDAETGKVLWSFASEPDCSGERKALGPHCQNVGMSGAPTVIDGAVVEGSLDGFLRVLDARSGKLLFQFDTARSFSAINGIDGKGGAIDNASIVAANGYLFVNSGYGMFGQMPGNVLLAFRARQ